MSKFKLFILFSVFLMTSFPVTGIIKDAGADEKAILERLEKIILEQQAQIESLQKQVNEIQAKSAETQKATQSAESSKGFIKSGNKNTSVTLYGQVNRGILISDDGDNTNIYQVDNDNSSTRIGINGSAKASEALEIGTKVEVQFESNSTADVNQNNQRGASSNNFTKRHLDLYLSSTPYGKLSIGFGSTASDGTSETDFSGTSVVGYSGVADMAYGQLFYDNNTKALSTAKIGNAFSNMDGLSRDERIRYDTPAFNGFSAAASYIADGGGDVALRYDTKLDQFKVGAAVAYANPASTSAKTDYQISSSFSALHDSGISLTLSGGQREYKTDTDGDGLFFYSKLGYQTDFFSIGKTAFSVDYGIFDDIAMNNDEASTFGAHFVQNITDWGTEYYLGYRLHKLDRDNTDFEDISAILSGFRVKF
ncbi:MAG: porin [Proteobacteria bacterium]|nr:porin [Pseudomonadota bacterium]MBU1582216.1 porin [Pseudomonadota bacterium]MBU2455600.1 porin [Pseudomonadota bacterium]MBU2627064.1 porin [Pseudomonadota bacterium]